MKLTGQAAIEAHREDSKAILFAELKGKKFAKVSEKNAFAAIERGGLVYTFVAPDPASDWSEIEIPEMKEGISIKDGRGNDLLK